MQYLIGIDIGTSGTKVALFDSAGLMLASHTEDYPLSQPQNGWAEQEPADWWAATVTGLQTVMRTSGVSPAQVAGIGLSGQMHGLVLLDSRGDVLRPAILWCDTRTGPQCDEITRRIGADKLIQITANPALPGFTAGKVLWVAQNQPEIFEKVRHVMLPKDYIRYRLTGEFATEYSDAAGTQLLDVGKRAFSPEMLSCVGLTSDMMGRLCESVEVTGTVTPAVATLCSLREGTPVVGGAADNAAAAVGTAVVREGRAFVTLGTSGVVYAHTKDMHLDPQGRVHTFCSAVPGEYLVLGCTQAAGLSLRWMRDQLCASDVALAAEMGVDPYVLMTKAAEEVPLGSDKLLFLPYLMGERTPHKDPDCRGCFVGLSGLHTRAHLIRSVMEGVAFSQADSAGIMKGMGLDIRTLTACGGGAQSALWRGMLGDIMGAKIGLPTHSGGAALGVAILAGVGASVYPNVTDAADALVSLHDERHVDTAAHENYQKLYKIYRDLYPALKPHFKALANLDLA